MDPIEVTARFDEDGKITPLSFRWQGSLYTVQSAGRRWEDGEGVHILAMAPGDQVVELVYAPAYHRWYMGRFGAPYRAA